MPRVQHITTNFTSGEISPRLRGRVDMARYQNAAKTLRNAYPVIQGGAKRRPGTRRIGVVKTPASRTRAIPFISSRDNAYMLEFGASYIRVWKRGIDPHLTEVASPYSATEILEVDFAQDGDLMFITHQSFPIYRLQRYSDTAWSLTVAPFAPGPFGDIPQNMAAGLTLSAATVGLNRTFTADTNDIWKPSDVNREIRGKPGRAQGLAIIRRVTSGTVAEADIVEAFASTTLLNGNWWLAGPPNAAITISAKEPVGATVSLTLSAAPGPQAVKTIESAVYASNLVTLQVTGHGYTTNDVIFANIQPGHSGNKVITVTDANHFTWYQSTPLIPVGTVQKIVTGTPDGWRSIDVGKYVTVNGGLVKITRVDTATIAQGEIINELASTTAVAALGWTLNEFYWDTANGYPRTVTIHDQRLITGGSPTFPQTIWGSRPGNYLDHTQSDNDGDGFAFTLASDEANQISFVTSAGVLTALTYGSEFSLRGGQEKPITPTNVKIKQESNRGSANVRPVTIANEAVFVQRARKKVRALGYRYDAGGFVIGYASPDISALSDHLLRPRIAEMAYMQEPDSLLWCVLDDGTLASCTYDKDQEVIGWAPHDTEAGAGFFESVCALPAPEGEELWFIVRRVINGVTTRYIERMEFTPATALLSDVNGLQTDCAAVIAGPLAQVNVFYLTAKLVSILADGAAHADKTVTLGGDAVFDLTTTNSAQVGLPYVSTIATLPPEFGTGTGTAQGQATSTSQIIVRLLETVGGYVNGQQIPYRSFGPVVLNQPPPTFTGDVRSSEMGWVDGDAPLAITQPQPFPLHVLAVIRTITVNQG